MTVCDSQTYEQCTQLMKTQMQLDLAPRSASSKHWIHLVDPDQVLPCMETSRILPWRFSDSTTLLNFNVLTFGILFGEGLCSYVVDLFLGIFCSHALKIFFIKLNILVCRKPPKRIPKNKSRMIYVCFYTKLFNELLTSCVDSSASNTKARETWFLVVITYNFRITSNRPIQRTNTLDILSANP